MSCDVDIRKDLFASIILGGGSTMFKGFVSRLEAELPKLVPSSMRTKVIAEDNRIYSIWQGGVMLANLPPFK
jgi:actin-related protein